MRPPPRRRLLGSGTQGGGGIFVFWRESLARGSINPITPIVPPRPSTVADCRAAGGRPGAAGGAGRRLRGQTDSCAVDASPKLSFTR